MTSPRLGHMELWLDQSETEYELEIIRNSNPVTLTYSVFYSY